MWNIIFIIAVFSLLLYLFQEKVTFFPVSLEKNFPLPEIPGRLLEKAFFKTSDGIELSGLFYLKTEADGKTIASLPYVLYSHGNGGHMIHRLVQMLGLKDLPVHFFLYDYRGYGASSGSPTVAGVILDGEAALKFLLSEKKITPENVLIYGVSLGTAVAATTLRNGGGKFAGLLLESGFQSLKTHAGLRFPIIGPLVLKTDLPTDSILATYYGPLLVIHSEADTVIPFWEGKNLFEASPSKQKTLLAMKSLGHNDAVWENAEYQIAWQKFLAKIFPSTASTASPAATPPK